MTLPLPSSLAYQTLEFQGATPRSLILIALALILFAFWSYKKTPELSKFKKILLALSRSLIFLLLLILLLKPVLTETLDKIHRRTLPILIDLSASMSKIPDRRADDDDLKRLALATQLLDPKNKLDQPLADLPNPADPVRLDVVKSVLKNPQLNLLNRLSEKYDLEIYAFDRDLTPLVRDKSDNWIDNLQASADSTALGDAVRQVISQKRGQPLAGLLIISDGVSNAGLQPAGAAALARQDHVPLYCYAVGIQNPRDIRLYPKITAPDVAFVDDDFEVLVRYRSPGLDNQTASLTLSMGDEKIEKTIPLAGDVEQTASVKLHPKSKGLFPLTASIQPRPDEVISTNNAASGAVRVIDSKIKVLHVEQYPRWEFQYLQAILQRDRRVEYRCILVEGDSSLSRVKNSPYLDRFPQSREELFKYDVIILGDLDPKNFSPQQIEYLTDFVSKMGGSLAMIAGKRFAPNAWRGTALEKTLPIEIEYETFAVANKPVKLELTSAGKNAPMLRLADTDLDSLAVWNSLPPIYWENRVARAKPAAEVLIVDPDPAKASRYGKMPLLALQQYGLGQTLYLGTDNLWRWRQNIGDKYHSILWSQIVQRLALAKLLGGAKKTQLSADSDSVIAGQSLSLLARLYTDNYEPLIQPSVSGKITETDSNSPPRLFTLNAAQGEPGTYRGGFTPSKPGKYQITLDRDETVKVDLAVTLADLETQDPAMSLQTLQKMAEASQGLLLREEDLADLPNKITLDATTTTHETKETLLIHNWSFYSILLAALTIQWTLRRAFGLK